MDLPYAHPMPLRPAQDDRGSGVPGRHAAGMPRLWLLLLSAAWLAASEPEHVRIQLNWYHQFQFAGIYAAEMRGYFADEALDVEISETRPGLDAAAELSAGRCQFAIHDSKIVVIGPRAGTSVWWPSSSNGTRRCCWSMPTAPT